MFVELKDGTLLNLNSVQVVQRGVGLQPYTIHIRGVVPMVLRVDDEDRQRIIAALLWGAELKPQTDRPSDEEAREPPAPVEKPDLDRFKNMQQQRYDKR